MGPALVSRAIHAERPNEPMLPTVRTAGLRGGARPAADWQVVRPADLVPRGRTGTRMARAANRTRRRLRSPDVRPCPYVYEEVNVREKELECIERQRTAAA